MPRGWTKPIRFLCYSLAATATMPSVLLRLCRCRARWLGSGLELTIGVSPGSLSPRPCCGALAHRSLFLDILHFAAILCQRHPSMLCQE